ncbi:FHA domain-containing protein DDL-like [Olea europaea var. sylvestris]|uniref:FHA domain-containing protein DDL-like n=1 Tax=Olea europaea var. sylvestris TaxID=158386 RepID=UPI000C1CDBB5|nr:FHA domain-containing protein DDL-like [Olea europaea var. sylvestris]
MGRRGSESPVRDRRSPRKRSPSRSERSPARHKNVEKPSTRKRSPKRARSRSPIPYSQVREKPSSHTRSPQRRKSASPVAVRQKPSSQTRSSKRAKSKSPPPSSPTREKPSNRTRSPKRSKLRSPMSPSLELGKPSNRAGSPKRAQSMSPESYSPSPRTKRLKRAQAGRDDEKGSVKDHEKNRVSKGDGATHRERDSDRNLPIERRDRSGRDAVNKESSRLRRSASPSERHYRSRQRSKSPRASDNRERNEVFGDIHSLNLIHLPVVKASRKMNIYFQYLFICASVDVVNNNIEEKNRKCSITLLFNEPPDARKPEIRWRLYVFKGGEVLNEPLYVHRLSCYLFGRERRVADIPTDHPSCSKQHAVLQYRQVEKENPDGTMSKQVRPYLMDLGSTNGTFINDDRLEPQRYYELFEKDTIKFGNSSREYVLLHENSSG